MTRRQYEFLNLLMKKRGFAPVRFYADKMGLSDKTLRREIHQLTPEISLHHAIIETRAGRGIRLDLANADMEGFLRLMDRWKGQQVSGRPVIWEKSFRRLDIALNLLLYSDEPASLAGLSYQYYVSKSSICNDIRALEGFFGNRRLSLLQNRQGIRLKGEEKDIRGALIDLILFILENAGDETVGRRPDGLNMKTMMTILDCFSETDLCWVERLYRELEREIRGNFDEREYCLVSITLLIIVYRIRAGFTLEDDCEFYEEAGDFRLQSGFCPELAKIGQSLKEQYGFCLSSAETGFLQESLSGTRMFCEFLLQDNPDGRETAAAFGRDFIDAFSVITEINLREKSSLYLNIISHILLMLNRLKRDAAAKNPFISQIISEYRGLINVCRIICWILVKKFRLPDISMDEICYLALYIQGEIMEQGEEARIVLVSNLQRGLVDIIRLKLLARHSKWEITTCSSRTYEELSQFQFDFTVTTVELDSKLQRIPCVRISPMLSQEDQQGVEAMFCYAKRFPDTYRQKLYSLLNDLKDLGCRIYVLSGDIQWIPEVESLRITGQKGIRYLYSQNGRRENSCRFVVNPKELRIEAILLSMDSWDLMLFASKLVYLLSSCQDFVASGFADQLMGEEEA